MILYKDTIVLMMWPPLLVWGQTDHVAVETEHCGNSQMCSCNGQPLP
jgi:hypothetical protein